MSDLLSDADIYHGGLLSRRTESLDPLDGLLPIGIAEQV
jgi:hypothetical protein